MTTKGSRRHVGGQKTGSISYLKVTQTVPSRKNHNAVHIQKAASSHVRVGTNCDDNAAGDGGGKAFGLDMDVRWFCLSY